MKVLKAAAFAAIIVFCAWALWSSRAEPPSVIAIVPTPECSPQALPPGYYSMNGALREFDDALLLAVNVPREMVVSQVEQLQRVRRTVEAEHTPACLAGFKASLLQYMNRVLELLVAFVGGAAPDSVMRGLVDASQLREPIYQHIAQLTGATVTPPPTPQPLPSGTPEAGLGIPVTGAAELRATVTHSEGVNLREGPGVLYNFQVVLGPGTLLQVLGTDSSRQWLLVAGPAGQQGWVFLPLVLLEGDPASLPVVTQN